MVQPAVWLFVAVLTGWVVGWAGDLAGSWSAWLAMPINALGAYLGFSVFHQSVHRTAHRNRIVDDPT